MHIVSSCIRQISRDIRLSGKPLIRNEHHQLSLPQAKFTKTKHMLILIHFSYYGYEKTVQFLLYKSAYDYS